VLARDVRFFAPDDEDDHSDEPSILTGFVPDDPWRALDAPFMPHERWSRQLEIGTCTLCGNPARRGLKRWWHVGETCWPVKPGRISRFRGD
jgi:hypothetical protein